MSRAKTTARASKLRRCTTQFSVSGPGYSYAAGVGRTVDLSEPTVAGRTLEDDTDPTWFAPLDEPAPQERDHGTADLDEG